MWTASVYVWDEMRDIPFTYYYFSRSLALD